MPIVLIILNLFNFYGTSYALDPYSQVKNFCSPAVIAQIIREPFLGSVQERIKTYQNIVDTQLSKALEPSIQSPELSCLTGKCVPISGNWAEIFRQNNLQVKRVLSTHSFLIDDVMGPGKEILIDPTYLQFLKSEELKLKYKPIFVGTLDDLRSFFSQHPNDLNNQMYVNDKNTSTVDALLKYAYGVGRSDSPFAKAIK